MCFGSLALELTLMFSALAVNFGPLLLPLYFLLLKLLLQLLLCLGI